MLVKQSGDLFSSRKNDRRQSRLGRNAPRHLLLKLPSANAPPHHASTYAAAFAIGFLTKHEPACPAFTAI
jgi:hypothetical protein